MKTVLKVTYVCMLVVTVVMGGSFVFASVFVSIQEAERYYITSWFREGRFYTQGHYFFPEKLLEAFALDVCTVKASPLQRFPVTVHKTVRLDLPRLSAFQEEAPELRYSFEYSYFISPENELALARAGYTAPFPFHEELEQLSRNHVKNAFLSRMQNNTELDTHTLFEDHKHTLTTHINTRYNKRIHLTNITCRLEESPDLVLYREEKHIVQELQKHALSQGIQAKYKQEQNRILLEEELTRLREYAKLLREYPEALHLLYVENLGAVAQDKALLKPQDITDRVNQLKQNKDTQLTTQKSAQ